MNVRKFLQQIDKLDQMIENKQAEIQRWKDIANNTAVGMSGERVQSSGNNDTTANAICAYVDLERETADLKEQRAKIIGIIERLSPAEYDLIHKVYVQKRLLKEIAYTKKRSYSWATTTHKNALNNLQKILNEM